MLRKVYARFSVYSNQHQRAREIVNGKEVAYDHNIQNYSVSIQAYLQKRFTKKSEIKGRMYVIEQIPNIQTNTQTLYPLSALMNNHRLEQMYEKNEITTPYIISVVAEEYFKPMMDVYLSKVLINGSMPQLTKYDQYKQVSDQIVGLYHVFFQGDPLSNLEKEIEFRYLALKQNKFFRYQHSQRGKDKCIWTYSQQRRVEMMRNWRARDVELYDDYRPIYEPLSLDDKLKSFEILSQIENYSIWKRLYFKLFERTRYIESKKRLNLISEYLFTRTMLYTNSIEFLRILGVPPDFHIELALINIHIWLLCDRLRQINTRQSKYLQMMLLKGMGKHTEIQVGKIHLRKKNELIRDIEAYLKSGRDYLEHHFNRNPETIKNNYFKLDALVWSIVYFEKVPRYSEQVYLMAEYIKTNYDFLGKVGYKNFDDCDIEFDVFRIGYDFKEKLLKVNPPLTEEEFTQEFLSDKKKKKYYYANEELKLEEDRSRPSLLVRRLEILNENLMYIGKKYYNLNTFDHFSNHEEQKREEKQKQKYIWNINDEIDSEQQRIEIMKRRREINQK